ncbi:hypothetical protein [Metabacillus arenae]|uniref:Uncharacterized protein n=1 Tax=Metabacillus arenae TaxID=2771434 RepID=A0A926NEW9_9BACI|nr:hypothetical protein [Metabacillus arenae]MBD1380274.1 hypothetical protein [Metabacillus arenae]
MEEYIKKSLDEWKEEISELLFEIDKEYEQVMKDLKVYSYKYNITKQVVQSTVNEEIIGKIRELYHQPFEEQYHELKKTVVELEEKRKVFQMFVDKIDKVKEKEEVRTEVQ